MSTGALYHAFSIYAYPLKWLSFEAGPRGPLLGFLRAVDSAPPYRLEVEVRQGGRLPCGVHRVVVEGQDPRAGDRHSTGLH